MSELPLMTTTILSFVSALIWNFVLLYAGLKLGENWQLIGSYLASYSRVVTGILVMAILVFLGRFFYNRSKTNEPGTKV